MKELKLSDIVNSLHEEHGADVTSKAAADRCVHHVFAEIQKALEAGDKVNIIGFGSFTVTEVADRQGKNPQTGEAMTIPAHKKVKFKAGKTLKDCMNK